MSRPAPALAFCKVGAPRARDLPPRELALLPPRAVEKRRREFAAGRVAARVAVRRLLGDAAHPALVLRDAASGSGRPVAYGPAGPLAAHVSITHAGGWAAAAADRRRVGIDLVVPEPFERAFVEDALGPEAEGAWSALAGAALGAGALGLSLAFAAKEAASKWLGVGLTVPLLALRALPAGGFAPARLGTMRAVHTALEVEGAGERASLDCWVAAPGGRALVLVAGWAAT